MSVMWPDVIQFAVGAASPLVCAYVYTRYLGLRWPLPAAWAVGAAGGAAAGPFLGEPAASAGCALSGVIALVLWWRNRRRRGRAVR